MAKVSSRLALSAFRHVSRSRKTKIAADANRTPQASDATTKPIDHSIPPGRTSAHMPK